MVKKYRIQKNNLIEALDEVEQFEISMNKFMDKYEGYKYTLDLQEAQEEGSKWTIDLNITKHE